MRDWSGETRPDEHVGRIWLFARRWNATFWGRGEVEGVQGGSSCHGGDESINNPELRCVRMVSRVTGAATSAGSVVQPFEVTRRLESLLIFCEFYSGMAASRAAASLRTTASVAEDDGGRRRRDGPPRLHRRAQFAAKPGTNRHA